jgi:hypothetical protein
MFVKKNFFALFEEKLNKLLDQLNISRISGIRPYRKPDIRQGNLVSGRIPDIKKAGLFGRISGASLKMQIFARLLSGAGKQRVYLYC